MPEIGSSTVFADAAERDEAQRLVDFLERSVPGAGGVLPLSAAPDLTPGFAKFLARVLHEVAEGHRVTVGTLPPELTTTVAAEQLGISRPTLMALIRGGELPAHKVGSHTRVKTKDVLEMRKRRIRKQRAALESLLKFEDELDID
ncbi:helix-turn-helix domain-containing protein [Demequina lignilytica]|uniref:Helix-turn-helix domain-containing protein n=1 Tax=Demequina lignilytica TaxID=3051663 RepID=A0AB35MHH3_9MICO|nr:helix-turn-helix domain-containing protein [Demequina sp. SYSU T0a273]MDN4483208.1 helix-turn-helix domain-containing protein [Demequina sp. SYSU T0a273]